MTTSIENSLQGVTRLFLDTAPVVYYVERNPTYFGRVRLIFEQIEIGALTAVTSPITLAECLIHPYRLGLSQLQQDFFNVIVSAENTVFQPVNAQIGRQAAVLRASYNVTLTDALQVATALVANCEAFLTNDLTLQRITELRIVVLDPVEG
ncbi:MAG TPA: VapC toxin family PIN domain ribonuclease [Cyanobacteria bacterium UBA12227]|nr:VapC toxin family PIN domain ribonuclease [Cyanobacteria bacterium UBA12227]HBY80487.1 VapC toxin family PIN domain ribonuclease [Cyanobacteria bacterium UBA11148]